MARPRPERPVSEANNSGSDTIFTTQTGEQAEKPVSEANNSGSDTAATRRPVAFPRSL